MTTDYDRRRRQLLELKDSLDLDAILLYANRCDSRFSVWLAGATCRSTNHYLICQHDSIEFIEVSYRSEELKERTDLPVIEVEEEHMFAEHFCKLFSGTKRIGIAGPAPFSHFLDLSARCISIDKELAKLMSLKSIDEIGRLKLLATNATAAVNLGWSELASSPQFSEKALAKQILINTLGQTDQQAFPITVISGERLKSSTVGAPTDRIVAESDPCLIDFGFIHQGLVVDLTRMYWINPSPLTQAYNLLHRSLLDSLKHAAPGVSIKEYIESIKSEIANNKLPLATLEIQDLGHGIGFGLHEEPFIGLAEYNDFKLTESMVLSIEPEIIVDGYRLRVEEMVTVAANGAKLITRE